MTFYQFIFQQRGNRWLFIISVIITIIQFVVFKYFYPYPNFIPIESNSYIEAAANNQFINWWPIGYSIFLRLIRFFTSSHRALVAIQYFILQASLFYLLFTVNYFMALGKWLFRVLAGISILNPLSFLISNGVTNDALITALSLIWMGQLIWIIYQPGRTLLLWHAITVLLLNMVRFNGLYNPLISLLVIGLTRLPRKEKKIGMTSIILLLLIFIGRTQYEYKQQTGFVRISIVSDWQVAANALNAYEKTTPISPENLPRRFRNLHTVVNHHLDSLHRSPHYTLMEKENYYFWNAQSPLITYMNNRFQYDSTTKLFARQAKISTTYCDYGWQLITSIPRTFLQYYIWPNMVKYFTPPSASVGWYNQNDKTASPVIAKWFNWKDNKAFTRFEKNKIEIAEYIPVTIFLINLVFILCSLTLFSLTGFKKSILFNNGITWWIALIWFTNFAFSVWASPIELRHQIFPMLITGIFDILLISWIIQWGHVKTTGSSNQEGFLIQPMI